MRIFLNIITGLMVAFTLPTLFLCILGLFKGGFKNEAAMVLVIFAYLAAFTSVVAFIFGTIGLIIDHNAGVSLSRISILGVTIGLVTTLTIAIVLMTSH